ncbi:phosphate ABC transporter substrate-binding protein PstS [Reyranella soli]|jgi:phosphate transport system substrate-binding protein|uniref:Phosphate-binding protein PstS n=1 Tax=Reyranella soli TaxID=1230389 RepID=A0A512NH70_9HYPH|nr:phosphate ABC transporter substrate-binding protein PstS [Reyranella soli]GEP58300.1 phosphate-binding protein PstS [Reyranella soli]
MGLFRYIGVGAVAACLQLSSAQADDITGAGSTFVAPILSKWSTDYSAKGGEGLSYQRIGSGAGISSLRSGTVDFAATDAPLKPAELQRLGFMQFPLVVGGVVPVLNLDGVKPGDVRLTGGLLADIYLGKLTRWNDPKIAELNPGISLPAATIIVAHRVDASGTTFNLTNYLSKVSADWRGKVGEGLSVSWPVGVGGRGNDGVAAFVKQTRNSISYVDFAYARRTGLAYALVQNRAGRYPVPTVKAFEAAMAASDWSSAQDFDVVITDPVGEDAYPIAATSFALMYATPRIASRTRAAVDFFRWGLQQGQTQATEVGYVALHPGVVSRIEDYWRARLSDAVLVSKQP